VYRGTPFIAVAKVLGPGGVVIDTPAVNYGTSDCAHVTVQNGCTATASYATGGNYLGSTGSASITITKKYASVTPAANSKFVDDPDPVLTGSTSGFLAGDNVVASYTRALGETAGTYTISASLSPAGVLGNYQITYNTAVFTINKHATAIAYTGPT